MTSGSQIAACYLASTAVLLGILGFQEALAGCIKVDFNRIRVCKTNGIDGNEEWGVERFNFEFLTNFASSQWSSCSYEYSAPYVNGDFKNTNGNSCQPPSPQYNFHGFYDCFMTFPPIYLTEQEFEAGVKVKVYAQVGDYDYVDDDQQKGWVFDNGPIWDYTFTWNMYGTTLTAAQVKAKGSGGVDFANALSLTGPAGRRARNYGHATYVGDAECEFDIDDFFDCEGSAGASIGAPDPETISDPAYGFAQENYVIAGALIGLSIAIVAMCCLVSTIRVWWLSKSKDNQYSKVLTVSDSDVERV